MRSLFCRVAFGAVLLGAAPAFADEAADQTSACVNGTGQAQIDACNWILQSGRWSGAALAWAYDDRGIGYHRMGQDANAVADYSRAIALDASDPQFFLNRGFAYKKLGKFNLAVQDYDQAIALKPDNPVTYLVRGEVYRDMGQFADAVDDFTHAIALRADFAKAFLDRGYAKRRLGDATGGDADIAKAKALDPNAE